MKSVAADAFLEKVLRQCEPCSLFRQIAMKGCVEAGKLWDAGEDFFRFSNEPQRCGDMQRSEMNSALEFAEHLRCDRLMRGQTRPSVDHAVPDCYRNIVLIFPQPTSNFLQ